MKNGATVAAFEKAFAQYVGAQFAIALNSGTSTLHAALVALGVKPGDKVATTPLTMSATSIAILQAGAIPVYVDVERDHWTIDYVQATPATIVVSLYGLSPALLPGLNGRVIDDAAQTLRKHSGCAFTSYSFQASKILALGEGGMLVTDSEELATKAREFSSLGYRMKADQPRIDPSVLKSPDYERHHSLGWNYRMNDLTAAAGLRLLTPKDGLGNSAAYYLKPDRQLCADLYRDAIEGCSWITPQYVPEGWTHDYWTFAIALESKELWKPFTDAIVRHGGEMPYGAWKLSYHEKPFAHLVRFPTGDLPYQSGGISTGVCPIAESLQPRLVQFQTNDLASAERNAKAVKKAIADVMREKAFREWKPMPMMPKLVGYPQPDATGTPCS